jgi:hypothetical protein
MYVAYVEDSFGRGTHFLARTKKNRLHLINSGSPKKKKKKKKNQTADNKRAAHTQVSGVRNALEHLCFPTGLG